MIQFRYYLNYKLITLDNQPAGEVFVVTRAGERRSVWWLGFIDVAVAKQLPGARPVKVDMYSYSYGDDIIRREWVTLPRDKCLQGCLVRNGVYGVTEDDAVRIVPRPGLRFRI
ncbi:hypothetical protein ACJO2E_08490 [Marinobacter sp. M1N3S26]|uniref:hypothetical protein n=1 Tax=Marinobacter sp. M1N3S26 TaxID=3382299 RepID=UPI00387AD3E8